MATREVLQYTLPETLVEQLILPVLKRQDITLSNIKINKVTASRFFSSLYFIEAHSSTNKTLKLYVKCLPEDSKKSELIKAPLQFINEIAFYQKIIPAFKQFQTENSPLETLPPLYVPKCYAAEGYENNYVVILKDMCTSGFVLLDRFKPMQLSEMTLAFSKLGRFHGFSLAMKIKAPEKFRKLTELLVEPVYVNPQYEDIHISAILSCFENVRPMMADFYGEESVYLKKYDNFMEWVFKVLPSQVVTDPSNEPYNVITHGDIWISNMLFHYGQDGNGPDDICFLDFQQVRYSSPGLDLGRILFIVLDKASREKHRDYLLHCYHESLGKTLCQFDLNHEYLFPFSKVESQLKKCSAYIVIITIFTLVLSLSNKQDAEFSGNKTEDLCNSIREMIQTNADCRQRILEVVEEFVGQGYMDISD